MEAEAGMINAEEGMIWKHINQQVLVEKEDSQTPRGRSSMVRPVTVFKLFTLDILCIYDMICDKVILFLMPNMIYHKS